MMDLLASGVQTYFDSLKKASYQRAAVVAIRIEVEKAIFN